MQAHIVAIGENALKTQEQFIILFDESATGLLRDVSIIQDFARDDEKFALQVGDKIAFGEQAYTFTDIGRLANKNLQELGHATILFGNHVDQDIANAIYLTPHEVPELTVGMTITYRQAEGLVTVDDIYKLMTNYKIGKSPLSLALGFGEVTIA
jgi:PTS system glucitol/sorbitol-specific IIA component